MYKKYKTFKIYKLENVQKIQDIQNTQIQMKTQIQIQRYKSKQYRSGELRSVSPQNGSDCETVYSSPSKQEGSTQNDCPYQAHPRGGGPDPIWAIWTQTIRGKTF